MGLHSECLVIVIPNFNDWEPLELLLRQLVPVALRMPWTVSVLVVDDASTMPMPPEWPGLDQSPPLPIEILQLRCNLGHQRAIALGLFHVHTTRPGSTVLVMDGDGEDRPEDVPRLLAAFDAAGRRHAVFAARTRRMESWTFQFFYRLYQLLHRALTGVEVRVGNFSVLPPAAVAGLMTVSDIWNHYAAAVYRARLPRRLLPLARGARLAGKSQMNFVGLLIHGVSAISVFSDRLSARLLAASAGASVVAILISLACAAVSIANPCALPAWAVYAAFILLGVVLQSTLFTAFFVFLIAHRRATAEFILARDAPHFILGVSAAGRQSSLARLALAVSSESPPVSIEVHR